MKGLDTIFFKQNSVFLFNLIKNINPPRLACELLSHSYNNEWQPNRLTFFDISTSTIRKSVLNQAKNITDKWKFDWVNLSTAAFKNTLRECLS